MKKEILIIGFFLFAFHVFSQNDSTKLYLGVNTEATFIYETVSSSCYSSGGKYIDPSVLVICGIKECSSYSSDKKYFEVMYKGKNYFIPTNEVTFKDENKDCYQIIKNMPDSLQYYYREYANQVGLLYHSKRIKEIINKMDANKTKGLTILTWTPFDMSEYTDGTGVRFEVYNPTKKTIKYISFTVRGYNPVDDPVRAKNGNYSIALRGVGPIAPEENATYSWDYVWFSGAFDYAKITLITLTYMDGTTKTIEKPTSIMLSSDDYNYAMND